MDTLDVMDLGRLLHALAVAEAMRGANDAMSLAMLTNDPQPFVVEEFVSVLRKADSALEHLEWRHTSHRKAEE